MAKSKKNTSQTKDWKTTADMSAEELRALQSRLNASLQKTISDVRSLGYEVAEILPDIRITNNIRSVGKTKVMNDARMYREYGYHYSRGKKVRDSDPFEKWEKPPVMQISISSRVCEDEQDLRDTLYHEVVHCIPNCFNHGKMFKIVSSQIDARFGTHIEVRKKMESEGDAPPIPQKSELLRMLGGHIGETVRFDKLEATFTGFNSRSKNCCNLTDVEGGMFVCSAYACALGLGLLD